MGIINLGNAFFHNAPEKVHHNVNVICDRQGGFIRLILVNMGRNKENYLNLKTSKHFTELNKKNKLLFIQSLFNIITTRKLSNTKNIQIH